MEVDGFDKLLPQAYEAHNNKQHSVEDRSKNQLYRFLNNASHILSRWFKGLIYTTVEKFASLWFLLVIFGPEKK